MKQLTVVFIAFIILVTVMSVDARRGLRRRLPLNKRKDIAQFTYEAAVKQLEYGRKLIERKKYKQAIDLFRKIVKKRPAAVVAAEAHFLIGEAYLKLGKYKKAFESYQKVIDKYPGYSDPEKVLERQFQIADLHYNSRGRKLLFLPIKVSASPEAAIEYYEKIIGNAPFSHYAEMAHYQIGRIYQKCKNYDEAIGAYEKLIQKFPSGQHLSEALYWLGQCHRHKAFGTRYDNVSLENSVYTFKRYCREFPQAERIEEVKAILNKLNREKAGEYYKIARFYEKQKKFPSAVIYYREIVENHPETKWAETARVHLEKIESSSFYKSEQKQKQNQTE